MATVPDPVGWEDISVSNGPANLWQAPDQGEVHVSLKRDGTIIWLRGTAGREEALSVAASLEPTNPDES